MCGKNGVATTRGVSMCFGEEVESGSKATA